MPVSFSVAQHPADRVQLSPDVQAGLTSEDILAQMAKEYQRGGQMLQFALAGEEGAGRDFTAKITHLIPTKNGFVDTVITAYNDHHALVIRPDDVWLAILSQFNLFVNGNAELLRANFVAHEGKKELRVVNVGSRFTLDFGSMARQMTDLIDQNVVDPKLRAWAIPTFTTSTVNDKTVAAVLLMSTLKEYFAYRMVGLRCGIPRVTLEGEKADWVDILGRLEKLKDYGIQTIAWYHLLRPVITRFVAAFDAPASGENLEFWCEVAHFKRGGSGPSYYSGWINAFNVFGTKGEWLGHGLDATADAPDAPESMDAEKFWATYATSGVLRDLVFDGTPYPRLDSRKVPPGYAKVDVTLDDNGELFSCAMIAGMVGTRVSSSDDTTLSEDGRDDTVRPVAGWWMFTK
ncbi:hypothetical protein B0H14DRAFT_2733207 [Mycena olivaceomarginata]|nr:hypothetical protein B0H14DRAFT_2733207 [Mycena olivaceomarginata]